MLLYVMKIFHFWMKGLEFSITSDCKYNLVFKTEAKLCRTVVVHSSLFFFYYMILFLLESIDCFFLTLNLKQVGMRSTNSLKGPMYACTDKL